MLDEAKLSQAITNTFDPGTVKRGTSYFREKRVSHLKVEQTSDGYSIVASVAGAMFEPYSVEIKLTEDLGAFKVDSHCSCPVGLDCKHGVAALLAAKTQTGTILPVSPSPKPPTNIVPLQQSLGNQGLSRPWTEWLKQIKSALSPIPAQPDDYPPEETRRLIYLIKREPNTTALIVELGIQRPGDVRTSGDLSLNSFLSSYPAATYLRRVDYLIARKLALAQPTAFINQMKLAGASGAELFGEIVATGRCRWVGGGKPHPMLSLAGTRRAKAAWRIDERGRQQPVLEVIPEAQTILPLIPPWYLDETTGACGPIEADLGDAAAQAWINGPTLLPEETNHLQSELPALSAELTMPVPQRIQVEVIHDPRPTFHLKLHSIECTGNFIIYQSLAHGNRAHLAKFEVDYGGLRLPVDGRSEPIEFFSEGKLVRYIRSYQRESDARQHLTEVGLMAASGLYYPQALGDHKNDLTSFNYEGWMDFLLYAVPRLKNAGWQVIVDPSFELQIVEPEEWYADAEESGIDWFGVEIGVQVDGKRVNLLPLLLQEIRKHPRILDRGEMSTADGKEFIPIHLPDGGILPFPTARFNQMLGVLLELFDERPLDQLGRVKLPRLRAAEISGVAEDSNWRWLGSAEVRRLSQQLRSFKSIQPVTPPPELRATLRPYQQEGLSWLQFLREYQLGGILADDMGLGKTIQTLGHLLLEKQSGRATTPTLVVAPTSLMATWRQEAERFAPDLRVLVLHGPGRKQHFDNMGDYDLVVTSYSVLPRDEGLLLKQHFHYVILDEAQYIKNPKTKYAQIVSALKTSHRLCLTGTPLENHLGELWSQFNFLLPGYLGDEPRFRKLFRNPIERGTDTDRQRLLARRVAPFMLRRRKEEVAQDLPAKTEIVQKVELDGPQRDLYEAIRLAMHDKVRKEVAAKGLSGSHIVILDALLKLRQVCCHPDLVKLESARKARESAKLELLMELLPEMVAEGRRVLLFSQFTTMLALIQIELQKANIQFVKLTGETTDRMTPVATFQAGKVPVFLISLKAGGTGLTLTAADTVIHYDPWWNPAVENQATDRAHRIGQTKPVFVYKLITASTVEEKILELQKRKRELVEGLLDESRVDSLSLTPEDLDVLFAPLE